MNYQLIRQNIIINANERRDILKKFIESLKTNSFSRDNKIDVVALNNNDNKHDAIISYVGETSQTDSESTGGLSLSKDNELRQNLGNNSSIKNHPVDSVISKNNHESASTWELPTIDKIGGQKENNRNLIKINTVFDNIKERYF